MAEVVLSHRAQELGWLPSLLAVDSAGTGAWHVGQGMDRRARAALARRGYDGSVHKARCFEEEWIGERDLFIALDRSHLHFLERLRRDGASPEIRLLLGVDDVPDPYWGDAPEFDECLTLIESGVDGLVETLTDRVKGAR
jgi:protein-tyrosine phosphatase